MPKYFSKTIIFSLLFTFALISTGCAYKRNISIPPSAYSESSDQLEIKIRKTTPLQRIFAMNFDETGGIVTTAASLAVMYWLVKGNFEKAEKANCVAQTGSAC